MPGFELPSNLVRQVSREEPGSPLRCWVDELPSTVEQLAQRWSLRLGRPFQPGGVTSWVAPARTDAGDLLVLKVGWRHPEALHEADGLRGWAGDGAVLLIDAVDLGATSGMLLETWRTGHDAGWRRPGASPH